MSTDISAVNLADDGSSYVPLSQPAPPPPPPQQQDERASTTAFVSQEKNIAIQQNTTKMDSTPIADVMDMGAGMGAGGEYASMEPPMMADQGGRMQSLMHQAPQHAMGPQMMPAQQQQAAPASKNPMNLTDDQMIALLAGVCATIAVSKGVQEKMATTIPKFLTEQGGRSTVGVVSTGLFAAVCFYFLKNYVVKA